ncbi:MAG: hypothetical protein ACI9FR_000587 [Cryomorphaceae bacterium]|jgi:hypothetical protein
MSKRTKVQWPELINQQQESGLNAAEFCRRNGANARYFSLRRQQLGGTSKSFVQVRPSIANQIAPAAQSIKLRVIEIDLPQEAALESLALLLNIQSKRTGFQTCQRSTCIVRRWTFARRLMSFVSWLRRSLP